MTIRSRRGSSRTSRPVAASCRRSFGRCCACHSRSARCTPRRRSGASRFGTRRARSRWVGTRTRGSDSSRRVWSDLRIGACARGLLYFATHHPKDRHWYLADARDAVRLAGTRRGLGDHGTGARSLRPGRGARRIWSRRRNATSPSTTATGSRSPKRSRFPTVPSCGPCGETRTEATKQTSVIQWMRLTTSAMSSRGVSSTSSSMTRSAMLCTESSR